MNLIPIQRALHRFRTASAVAAALASAGCVQMQPGRGFDEVQHQVAQRLGADVRVHWNSGSPEDKAVADAVAALLARPEGLSAEQAVQVALLNNRELQAVYEELNVSQADLVQAGLLRNPVLRGDIRFGVNAPGTGAALDVAQDFVSLLTRPLRKGRAEAAFEAAKLRVTAAIVDTASAARSAFYEYQAAEQTRALRQTVLEATAASYELAKRVREAGNFTELDLLNERDLHEQAKMDLSRAEADAVQARERLNALMGVWGAQTRWRCTDRLPDLPGDEPALEGLESRAVAASLDLAAARREVEVAARTLGLARPYAWLTDLEAGATAERELDGAWSLGPAISLPLPLFDQGQGAIGKAEARLRQAAERLYALAVELRAQIRAAGSAVCTSRDRARYYEHVILPLRAEIVRQTQLQYNAMQVSAFQLLQARRNQIEAGARYIEALRDYWIARTRLEQVLSGRLPDPHESSEPRPKSAADAGNVADTPDGRPDYQSATIPGGE